LLCISQLASRGQRAEWEGSLGYHDMEDKDQTTPLIMNRVNSGIPGSHYPVSLINSIVGDRQFDCSGMGSGEIGIQWMCAAGASTNIGESVEEQLGLVVRKVTFNHTL
jgi:hypothetical protein